MIQGWFEDTEPTIMARVLIPRLMVNTYTTFLVDTGSDSTGIHPDPNVFADLPYTQLENPFVITGATGSSMRFTEPATIAIASADGASVYHYDVDIWIATPQDAPAGLPCILGQDILKDLRMTTTPRTTSSLSRYAEQTAPLHCQVADQPGAKPSQTRQAGRQMVDQIHIPETAHSWSDRQGTIPGLLDLLEFLNGCRNFVVGDELQLSRALR